MKIRTAVLSFTACVCIAASAAAQSGGIAIAPPGNASSIGSHGRNVEDQARVSQALSAQQSEYSALYSGRYSVAELDAKQEIESELPDPGAEGVLAAALAAQGKTQDALAAYAKTNANPENQLPYALLLLRQGLWKEALDAYNRALPHIGSLVIDGHKLLVEDSSYSYDSPAPDELETDIHIALGFTGIDDYGIAGPRSRDKSVAEYQQALRLSPDSPLANLAYGNGLKEDGRWSDADVVYRDVITKYSGDVKIAAEKETGEYYRSPEYLAAAAAAAKAHRPPP